MRYKRFLFISAFLCFIAAGPSSAQQVLEIYKKEVPTFELQSLDSFKAEGTVYQNTPFRDEALAYEITLPSSWKEGNTFGYSLSKHVMVEAGEFRGPVKFNKESSHLVIRAMELDYQTSTKEWFGSYVLKNGFSVQGAQEHSEHLVEALHVEYKNGETYIVRSLTMINGSRLMQVAYYLPSTSWEDEKVLQNQVVNSFRLKSIVKSSVGEVETYEFLDISEFDYPKSWNFKGPEEKSLDYMRATLTNFDALKLANQARIINGRIRFSMLSGFVAESVDEEMAKHLDDLMSRGFVVQNQRDEKQSFRLSKDVTRVRVETYDVLDGRYPNRDTELWLVGLEAGDYYYVLSLVTPSRTSDYGVWTQNTEALKLVLESFKPNMNIDDY